jgi:hypothetical protein
MKRRVEALAASGGIAGGDAGATECCLVATCHAP